MDRMKLVVGYDGSAQADAAIEDLQRAGLPETFEAVVLTVSDIWLPDEVGAPVRTTSGAVESAEVRPVRALRDAHVLAEHGRDRLRELFPTAHVRAEARADNPGWALLEKLNEWNPELVVVGSHGRTALGRVFLGSVSQRVLAEAHSSVRIGRAMRSAPGDPVRIVIGADGSRDARAAVREAANRHWPAGTQVRLVSAHSPVSLHPPPSLGSRPSGEFDRVDDETLRRIRLQLDDASELLRERGLDVESVLNVGSPVATLEREIETWNADVVFLGARGHRPLERLFLGSVSSAIAARAVCSVEVIRPWKGNDDEA